MTCEDNCCKTLLKKRINYLSNDVFNKNVLVMKSFFMNNRLLSKRINKKWLIKHKLKFGFGFLTLFSSFWIYYSSHTEETPITGRKRFIAIKQKQMDSIYESRFREIKEIYKNHFLPSNDRNVDKVKKIALKLIQSNNDLEQVQDKEWTISVINDPYVRNAFVIPTGKIFLFTGILDICDNDEQLAVIIAHEMAHALLSHGSEHASNARFVDTIFIFIIGAIWALMPDNYASHMTTKFFDFVKENILNTAYSRMLETEADLVGLELAAKACFDVRESSALWRKFSILKENKISINDAEIGIEEDFLSTHPSHESRYAYLDSIMDNAIKIRDKCNCPKLLSPDPRVLIGQWGQKKLEEDEKKIDNGVIPLQKQTNKI